MAEPKKFATQENLQALIDELKTRVVRSEEGKGLSTNDLTAELLAKINSAQSAEEVAAAVAAADHMKRVIKETKEEIDLTAADAEQYIYLVKNGEVYDEYMVVEGKLEKVGDWKTDLTGYLKETDLTELTAGDIAGLFASWQ